MKNIDTSKKDNRFVQKGNKRNEYMIKMLKYLSVICFLLFLFTLIILLFIIYQGATTNNFSYLTEASAATMLSIAITVWIGLNIYNVISKEDLDNFVAEQREQIDIVNEKSDEAINRLDAKTSIHKLLIMLEETMDRYVVSYYFMLKFAKDDDTVYNVDDLVEIEYFFSKTTKYYERDNYQVSLRYNKECMGKLLEYKTKPINNQLVQAFLDCREADLIYYANVCNDKIGNGINENELLSSLDIYDDISKYIAKDNSVEYINNEVLGYIFNTTGITYQLILKYKKDMISHEKAELGFANAINIYKDSSRYKRNYGAFLEKNKSNTEENIDKIIKLYKASMELDPDDYKAINAYYSYILKTIENLTGLNDTDLWGTVDLDEAISKLETYDYDLLKYKNNCIKIINESIYKFEQAKVIAPIFCDSYYNKAKAYLLKSYFDGKDDKLFLDGIDCCDVALSINSKCLGALYIKRNLYELYNELDKAKETNEQLRSMGGRVKDKSIYEKQ